ncbi:hypothetical protein LR48_Vigan441s000400 [Vigna angularis]|uniref:Uncharacterized protein n=1 Tax=Phaseolus angularis TaxID=3914 RepID=A0A0L9TAK8_PHAAN|nr:hypothetical protein LR48_Vigan441s000400 [Vigna angularis]
MWVQSQIKHEVAAERNPPYCQFQDLLLCPSAANVSSPISKLAGPCAANCSCCQRVQLFLDVASAGLLLLGRAKAANYWMPPVWDVGPVMRLLLSSQAVGSVLLLDLLSVDPSVGRDGRAEAAVRELLKQLDEEWMSCFLYSLLDQLLDSVAVAAFARREASSKLLELTWNSPLFIFKPAGPPIQGFCAGSACCWMMSVSVVRAKLLDALKLLAGPRPRVPLLLWKPPAP